VIGCPRSGTTLLRNLLRSHPAHAIPPESHFVPAFHRAWGDPPHDRAARRLAARILALHWVRRWELDLTPRDFDGCRTYGELVGRLYRAVAARDGAARWGDKTPAYAREIPALDRIFPDAQFVHIVRDGRDVALSLQRTGFLPRTAFTAARFWKAHVAAARRDGPPLGPSRYLEIGYEDLLRDTEATMRRVCAFLDERFDARVLAPSPLDWRRFPPTFGPRRPRHVSETELVRDNVGKWRRAMAPRDVAVFEAVAGDLLAELGYEIAGPQRPVHRLARAAWTASDRMRWIGYQLVRENKRLWVPSELLLRWARLRGATPWGAARRPPAAGVR
jgi:hypothetical protein